MTIEIHILDIAQRLQSVERRIATMARYGTVAAVDPKSHRVRLRLGGDDKDPFLSGWVPYAQIASGTMKVHVVPTVGQQMRLISPAGEIRQAMAEPMTWSDAIASPSTSSEEAVVTFGDVRVEIRDGEVVVKAPKLRLEAGSASLVMTDGSIEIAADAVRVKGQSLRHNAKSVGDGHTHTGVMPGPALTGPPAG